MVWGCSFILIKRALVAFSPVQVASLRIIISALAFTPLLVRYIGEIKKVEWKNLLLVGLLGSGIPAFCYAIAQTQISSAVAGILNSLTPLWTLVVGWALFATAVDTRKIGGVITGLVGASCLILTLNQNGANSNLLFALFIVVGTLCYGTSGNIVKNKLQGLSSLSISAVAFTMIGPPALVILCLTDFVEVTQIHPHAIKSLIAILILALIGTVTMSVLYFSLVKRTDALFASTVSYLIPLVALGLGALDGESITVWQILSFVMILSGVYLSRGKSS